MAKPPLVLASGSPRRHELLARLGVLFDVVVSDAPETLVPTLPPEAQAAVLAGRKARLIASRLGAGLVLGADTMVVLDNEVLGKPRHGEDAVRMLGWLSGRAHRVITGLVLIDAASGAERASSVVSSVCLRPLHDDDIVGYVATGEPNDKAGAYAIQGLGAALIAGFDGCFTNVVGLPLCETARLLDEAGIPIAATPPICLLPDGTPCPRLV
jgi:septum formation protein